MNNSKKRYTEIQSLLEKCGESGCHFLSLLSIVEEVNSEPVDLIEAIKMSLAKKYIDENFFVKAGDSLLEYFTGKKWTRKIVKTLPSKIKDNEYTEAIYFNPRTNLYHYRRRGFDTLKSSVTVREGYVLKYYIWRHN